jgi:hypothetical protein
MIPGCLYRSSLETMNEQMTLATLVVSNDFALSLSIFALNGFVHGMIQVRSMTELDQPE